jgi:hypothetical protein
MTLSQRMRSRSRDADSQPVHDMRSGTFPDIIDQACALQPLRVANSEAEAPPWTEAVAVSVRADLSEHFNEVLHRL